MFKQAYILICEILNDEQLNSYIHEITGKYLTIINAGPVIDTPAASITLTGGEVSRKFNTSSDLQFNVAFAMPFWGIDGFSLGLEFVDNILPVFMAYGNGEKNQNIITRIVPSINEQDPENNFWIINFSLTIKIFN